MFWSHFWQPWVRPEVATFGNLLRHKVAKSGNFPAGCQKWQLLDVPINGENKSQLVSIIGVMVLFLPFMARSDYCQFWQE